VYYLSCGLTSNSERNLRRTQAGTTYLFVLEGEGAPPPILKKTKRDESKTDIAEEFAEKVVVG